MSNITFNSYYLICLLSKPIFGMKTEFYHVQNNTNKYKQILAKISVVEKQNYVQMECTICIERD